ncbi:MAG TPA: hypothetical protein VKB05_09300 [Pyrinomonadaceae bacterium]|nr:hypothetical protein [Pyrinomonadaceae bacterium]
MSNAARKLIGAISDTHGLVRTQAIEAMAGVEISLLANELLDYGLRRPS